MLDLYNLVIMRLFSFRQSKGSGYNDLTCELAQMSAIQYLDIHHVNVQKIKHVFKITASFVVDKVSLQLVIY